MASSLRSLDDMIRNASDYGTRIVTCQNTVANATTAATATSGYMTGQKARSPYTFTCGGDCIGAYVTRLTAQSEDTGTNYVLALEYEMIRLRHINVTMTANATTNILTVASHGASVGDWVRFTTTTTLPAPLVAGTDYYIISDSFTTGQFKVSATSGGSEIDITDTGTGTHTCFYGVTPGVSMPIKKIKGTNVQTCSKMTILGMEATATATAPVITITYTDQDGNTGASAQLTLPNNSVIKTAYQVGPHLASGDIGMRSVQNIVTSAGTAGTYVVYGLLPLASTLYGVSRPVAIAPLALPSEMYLVENGDKINLYRFGSNITNTAFAVYTLTPEAN